MSQQEKNKEETSCSHEDHIVIINNRNFVKANKVLEYSTESFLSIDYIWAVAEGRTHITDQSS